MANKLTLAELSKQIAALQLELVGPVKQMSSQLTEIKDELSTLKNQAAVDKQEVMSEIDELRQTIVDLTGRVQKAEHTLAIHDFDITSLNEAESSGHSLTINGIPKRDGESLNEIYNNIASKIGIAQAPRAHLFRLNVKSPAPTIVVRFDSQMAKNEFKFNFLKVAKTLFVHKLPGFNDSPAGSRVYIQDLMSKATYTLHKAAVKFKNEKKLSSVIIEQSKIFVKLQKDGIKARVYSVKHLEKLIKHAA